MKCRPILIDSNLSDSIYSRRHLEWWYSNVMPYIRGSAAVSEGISKTTLLSHRALPTQMLKTLPDLIAICQCDEKGYVAKYPSVYPDHKYCPASIATQLTDKAQLRP